MVSILTLRTERVRPRTLWEGFFLPPDARQRSSGLGSGFLIDADGTILTNDHVVRGAERIMVTLPDGRDLEAELVGTDEVTDVAVLRVAGENLPAAPIGTSEGLIIGEWAVAIGNPFGNLFSNSEPTVTAGVISAVGRHIVPSSEDRGFYLGMIQTDASINPGNSGGPLVNALGQVIGVNASIFTRSGGSEGLGFAIPIDRALRVADDLVRHGEVRRAWLGLDVEPVEADPWGRTRGVRVSRVVEGSPAARAGIRPGARLLEARGSRLTAPLDFEDVLLDLRAGDEIALSLEGAPRPVTVRAEALPTSRAERVTALQDLDLITLTPQVRAQRGIVSEAGAMIVSISPELEAQLGFREGDVIVRINNVAIQSAEDAARVFRELRGQSGRIRLRFVIERNGDYGVR
ncbi:MAG TPA: trypsin-like peptidase domain-containing protein, partial [Candidatus Thermoplasmatota archaeon]